MKFTRFILLKDFVLDYNMKLNLVLEMLNQKSSWWNNYECCLKSMLKDLSRNND